MKTNPVTLSTHCLILAFALSALHSLSPADELDLTTFARGGEHALVHNRNVAVARNDQRNVLSLSAGAGDGLAWRDDIHFTTGVIECDFRGRNNPGASFVGIAFHGADASTFEAVYFRPFNFTQADPERRAHSVQYISMPDHGWQELRQNHPGVYESAITPAPDPDDWQHARIVIEAKQVSVFVNAAAQPCLVVERISDRASGWVGLWVGNGSDGSFADLKITPLTP